VSSGPPEQPVILLTTVGEMIARATGAASGCARGRRSCGRASAVVRVGAARIWLARRIEGSMRMWPGGCAGDRATSIRAGRGFHVSSTSAQDFPMRHRPRTLHPRDIGPPNSNPRCERSAYVRRGLLRIGRIEFGCGHHQPETVVWRNGDARRWARESGRTMARCGLRMMPPFPSPPLKVGSETGAPV
jgi:hypothetical protein